MGACCSGGNAQDIQAVIKIQTAVRTFLRKKSRVSNLKAFIEEIAGKYLESLKHVSAD